MRNLSFFLLTALGLLSGCGVGGALSQASVSEGCAGSTLPCATAADFNAPVAVGASVTLSIDLALQGGGQPPLGLVSSDEGVFTVKERTLTGVGPGFATLLLVSDQSVVLDFVAVYAQQASDLAVSRLAEEGADLGEVSGGMGVLVGGTVSLAVSALSSTQPLAGAPPLTWSVADPSIVSILDQGIAGRETLAGRAPGMTTVTVSALGLQRSFAVEVTP